MLGQPQRHPCSPGRPLVRHRPGLAQMPHPRQHDLRHTAASLAVSAGANVKAVQRMLGHESAALTLDIYADLFDDDLDTVADALDAARRRIPALATV
nr:tyrosine-type recombinase/integrase [Rhodococcus marinonascens]